MPRPSSSLRPALAAGALLALAPLDAAQASTGAATGLPWEGAVQTVVNSFTGPIASGFAVLAIAGAGYKWYQSDHGQGANALVKAIIAIALVVLGTNVLATLGLVGSVLR